MEGILIQKKNQIDAYYLRNKKNNTAKIPPEFIRQNKRKLHQSLFPNASNIFSEIHLVSETIFALIITFFENCNVK
jgi:hypothetical protein